MNGKRVVIADDDPDIRALVAIAVRKAGLELIASTEDGNAAWRAIHSLGPDLAVLDVSMPGMTGLEVCRLIRAEVTLSAARVVLLSAGVDDRSSEAGIDAGADAYLSKPFSPRKLAGRLAAIMETNE